MSIAEFPQVIITDTETKAVRLTPAIEATLPDIGQAFAEADKAFLDDPEKYLQDLEASMFKFRSSEGSNVVCSLLYGSNSKPDQALVIFAPFADRDPKSSANKLSEYIAADTPGGIISKERFAPNSWNQTAKSAAIFELLGALGKNVPVLTIYGSVPSHAYSYRERGQLRSGDFSPAGRLAKEALAEAQDRLHGPDSETQIDTVRFSGASLGASNAIGAAASKEVLHDFDVPTVSAQELILGPKNLPDLGKRFTSIVGEPSDETVSQHNPKIEETAMRKAVDAHGSEIVGMNARMIKGMKPTYMKGLTKPEATVQAVERLLDNNVNFLVALAENSALTYQTASYLPNSGERVVTIRGENGQKIGHLADEHVALSALIIALNLEQRNQAKKTA
ncbi:MAG TPA: hypothetical protein VH234_00200 [Candidatus Saccharimonadales bacterium]|nr:hypothetical protein [Candidatus Saccharimonadales bacterium]